MFTQPVKAQRVSELRRKVRFEVELRLSQNWKGQSGRVEVDDATKN